MNKIVFFILLTLSSSLLADAPADAPVEIGGHNLSRLAEELATLQKFIYKRFGGDPAYQEAGANPPEDPSHTLFLEKIQSLKAQVSGVISKMEELQQQILTSKSEAEKRQASFEGKIASLEKTISDTTETVQKSDDQAYQDKLNKMSADELRLHIETSGRILPEKRFEKALHLFVTKFPNDPHIASIYKELVYVTYKKDEYQEAALYAGEFYKKSPKAPEAPEVLLMMAFALEKLGKNKEACTTLTKIKTDYPKTSEDFQERLSMAFASLSCLA